MIHLVTVLLNAFLRITKLLVILNRTFPHPYLKLACDESEPRTELPSLPDRPVLQICPIKTDTICADALRDIKLLALKERATPITETSV